MGFPAQTRTSLRFVRLLIFVFLSGGPGHVVRDGLADELSNADASSFGASFCVVLEPVVPANRRLGRFGHVLGWYMPDFRFIRHLLHEPYGTSSLHCSPRSLRNIILALFETNVVFAIP